MHKAMGERHKNKQCESVINSAIVEEEKCFLPTSRKLALSLNNGD